jgi:transcriptional regulator with XRE-family HTH domain
VKNEEKTERKQESDAPREAENQRQIQKTENDAWSVGVGARISAAIDEIGSQALAAHAAGVSVSTLQRYVRGDVAAPFKALAGLAREAQVSLDWLATGEGRRKAGLAGARPAAARHGAHAQEDSGTIEEEDVRIFFGVVRAVDRLEEQLAEPVKADIAMRMRYALATMARDQDHQARLDQDDLDQLARLARKLL